MTKYITILVISLSSIVVTLAQSPEGTWVTIDDKRNVDIAHVKIFKEDGMLYGKVLKLLPEARVRTCEGCSGDLKDKPLKGVTLITDVKPTGNKYWSKGKLLDPKSGRQYSCSIWLDDPNTLKVRASFGISLIGRTQTWRRLR